jgi:cytochrome c peroxidase
MKQLQVKPLWFLSGILLLVGVAFAAGNFPPMLYPKDNPQTPEKIELGRKLFYDKRLSQDDTISCESCHLQKFAFSDGGKRVSKGIGGLEGTRNAPSLGNIGYRKSFFWEGGSKSLELQAMGPLTAHDEMGVEPADLVQKLSAIPEYVSGFKTVFSDGLTMLNITRALSSFERTLVTASSPFDAYRAGNETAMSPAAVRGMKIFTGERGECFHCHTGFNFTDESLHNDALYVKYKDEGLARITKQAVDAGAFKTPSLRNVALTAPYFHDGSRKTLQDVLKHYNKGGEANPNADPVLKPLELSPSEINDLIAFLNALTDKAFSKNPNFGRPESNPSPSGP